METNAIIKQIYSQARQLGCCDLFKGTEDFEALVRLFRSPQGVEFCMNNHFPNTATFRLFKPLRPEQYGIYIDAGNITLTNPDKAILIGRTTARQERHPTRGYPASRRKGSRERLPLGGVLHED